MIINHGICQLFFYSYKSNSYFSGGEPTEVLHGEQNVIRSELQLFCNSKKKIDTCMNYTRPPLAITIDPIRGAFVDAKKRGIKLRYLTEITKDNISFCKQLVSLVDELRHLDGIKGNFMVSESEYLAPTILFENNSDEKGSTFYFTLPFIKEKKVE